MKKQKIFLASSSELKEDRDQFELLISTKNYKLFEKGVILEVVRWENFLDAISDTRLQDEYNKAINECDIFIMLFFTKVGKYTEEEFETAFKHFKATNKPYIFTYFKDAPISTGSLNDDVLSLIQFKKKLDSLGHFYSTYKTIDDLKYKFSEQLNKLDDKGFLKEATNQSTAITQTNTINGDVGTSITAVNTGDITIN